MGHIEPRYYTVFDARAPRVGFAAAYHAQATGFCAHALAVQQLPPHPNSRGQWPSQHSSIIVGQAEQGVRIRLCLELPPDLAREESCLPRAARQQRCEKRTSTIFNKGAVLLHVAGLAPAAGLLCEAALRVPKVYRA